MKTFIGKLFKIGVFWIIGLTLCKIFGFAIGKLIVTGLNILLVWITLIQKESGKRLFFSELLLCNSMVLLPLTYYSFIESFWLCVLYTFLTWAVVLLVLIGIRRILHVIDNRLQRKIKETEIEIFKKKLGI